MRRKSIDNGMIDTTKINRLTEIIGNARNITVVTHMKPDGDAMGCSLAIYHFLRQNTSGNIRIVLNDRYPSNLAFMVSEEAGKDIIIHSEDAEKACECILDGLQRLPPHRQTRRASKRSLWHKGSYRSPPESRPTEFRYCIFRSGDIFGIGTAVPHPQSHAPM